jgi:hypothetical protein
MLKSKGLNLRWLEDSENDLRELKTNNTEECGKCCKGDQVLETISGWITPVIGLFILNVFCKPILFAICTSTFSKLCKNVYSGM